VLAVAAFTIGAAVSLVTSWLLVSRLERVAERLGFSEALLGIVAALAADAPEITAAISALTSHQQRIGAGVVLGSNVFNLAALLGLGAVVAGRIKLHRKVVALGGAIALSVALISLLVVSGAVPPLAGLLVAIVVLAIYLLILGTQGQRPRLSARWQAWLRSAVSEEELELEDAIRPSRGRWPDVVTAAGALVVVVVASVTMERSASDLGRHWGVPEIVTGGLVLAAVTSLPNAVAAVYLASRGRGAATLSTALNSNTLNVVGGLLLPGVLLGLGQPSGQALLVTAWYAGLSLAVLVLAWRHQGINRRAGTAIIAAYAAFTASLIVSGYATAGNRVLVIGLGIVSAVILLVATASALARRAPEGHDHGSRPDDYQGQDRLDRAADFSGNGHKPPGRALAMRTDNRASLVPEWPARRVGAASMLVTAAIAGIDAATGHRAILIGLLAAGPCLALLSGKRLLTILAGAWACGLAVVLGLPDGIWATATHFAFIAAVAVVALAASVGAAAISRARH
jgi:cation:H+ antiporter